VGHALARHPSQELRHLLDEDLGVPRLDERAVGPDLAATGLVIGGRVAAKDDDRDGAEGRVALERLAQIVAVLSGHDRVGQDEIGAALTCERHGLLCAPGGRDLEVGVSEGDRNDLLHRDAVVGTQNVLGHRGLEPPGE
jgi:hypothetical protein